MTGSVPITVTTRPIAPASRPFVSDAPVSPATIDSARMKSEKYSHGPNSSAMLRQRLGGADEEHAAEQPAEERGPDAEPDARGRARLCAPSESRRTSWRSTTACPECRAGSEAIRPPARAADVDAGHRREALQRIEAEGERQHHDDRHGDRDARQRAADHADQRAENSGTRYFRCRMLTMPCQSSSYMLTSPSSARAAAAPADSARTRDRSPPPCRARATAREPAHWRCCGGSSSAWTPRRRAKVAMRKPSSGSSADVDAEDQRTRPRPAP